VLFSQGAGGGTILLKIPHVTEMLRAFKHVGFEDLCPSVLNLVLSLGKNKGLIHGIKTVIYLAF